MGEHPEDLANQLFNVSDTWMMIEMDSLFRLSVFRAIRMKLISLILYVCGIFY